MCDRTQAGNAKKSTATYSEASLTHEQEQGSTKGYAHIPSSTTTKKTRPSEVVKIPGRAGQTKINHKLDLRGPEKRSGVPAKRLKTAQPPTGQRAASVRCIRTSRRPPTAKPAGGSASRSASHCSTALSMAPFGGLPYFQAAPPCTKLPISSLLDRYPGQHKTTLLMSAL